MARRTAIPYSAAIKWLAGNDDTEWLHDEDPIPSVATCLVADIYGRTEKEVTYDLRAAVAKETAR